MEDTLIDSVLCCETLEMLLSPQINAPVSRRPVQEMSFCGNERKTDTDA